MIVSAPLLSAVAELGHWAGRRRVRFRIEGVSMEPTLKAGEFVLVDPSAVPSVGELALALHPEDDDVLVVKRLTDRLDDDTLVLTSDNPAGTDSRVWGPVGGDRLRGRVTLILDRPLGSLAVGAVATASSSSRSVPTSWSRWLRR